MKNLKISIILPIHNAGQYLDTCLNSLINQTLKDIEIICVLDCPTDKSDCVVKDFAKKDNRIIIVENQKNLYIGLSRNEGLKIAKGEYIGFCDHDDWYEPNMCELLYNKARKDDADIVVSDFYEVYLKNNKLKYIEIDTNKFSKNYQEQHYLELLGPETFHFKNKNPIFISGNIWHRIYKTSLIKNNHIVFYDNRKTAYDDLIFNIQTHLFAKQVSYLSKPFYYHSFHSKNNFSKYEYNQLSNIIKYYHTIKSFISTEIEYQRLNNRMFFYFFVQVKKNILFLKLKNLMILFSNKDFLTLFRNRSFPFSLKETGWKFFIFYTIFISMKISCFVHKKK